ncbi:MAG: efflux RND transporter permease subunit [Pseudomonadales bacterium]|nr:efflux RND transporter permease subunit [Pseudomonadales bacterium]MDP6472852.1 efflux RND transporter permease subunit [Pseudomonadales bacterium]MDP6826392.1 efflux RND transporter permease subunit [Pseudomonadales bacterium]MDP6972528.1 efflux RND transporter permease subunit [Pseudomonadales bacterium]
MRRPRSGQTRCRHIRATAGACATDRGERTADQPAAGSYRHHVRQRIRGDNGAGFESRRVLGIVIFSGVSFATVLTLFVVPAFYKLLASRTGSPASIERELDELAHP